jgi:hypothetical protein
MELELRFEGLSEELVDAEVDVQVQDLGVADAPPRPRVATVQSISASPAAPTVAIAVDLPTDGGYEPGLLVRVRGRTADGGRIEFFNTSATRVHGGPTGPVQVVLFRIR